MLSKCYTIFIICQTPNHRTMKTQSNEYPQVPYSRDAGDYCPVTGEPGDFYLGKEGKQTGTQTGLRVS